MAVEQQQVERLCAKTGVSESAARAALEQTGGDLLAAVLLLERVGQIPPVPGGTFSTVAGASGAKPGGGAARSGAYRAEARPKKAKAAPAGGGDRDKGAKSEFDWVGLWKRILHVLRYLKWEVWRDGKCTVALPIVLVLVLLLVRFPLGLLLLAVCLLLGCRYRLSGADFPGMSYINDFLDGAYALVSDLVGDVTARHNQVKQDKDDKRRNR